MRAKDEPNELEERQRSLAARLRTLPSVDRLLGTSDAEHLETTFGRPLTVQAIRGALDEARQEIVSGSRQSIADGEVLARAEDALLSQLAPTMRPVINATGVIVHTNLGRAVLSDASIAALVATAESYSNLEFDLSVGARGSRSVHAEELLKELTGAEAAHTVNNNAAAVLLMLTALCAAREVVISRGQLIEIGGGFRIPDVMAQSGAKLVEVGTTNRTHIRDYERALTEQTAAILVAHHSNFRIVGFTSEPELGELAELAHKNGIPMLFDQGSGAVHDTSRFGLEPEITVQDALRAGVDVVAFSGDKLLGGPQAGILVGRLHLLSQVKQHPLARAVRADKMCLAALGATIQSHLRERYTTELPVWRMISVSIEGIGQRAQQWTGRLVMAGLSAEVINGYSTVGGGSLPGSTLATRLVAIEHPNVDRLAAALRAMELPVVGRIVDGRLVLDPRTVLEEQDDSLLAAITECAAQLAA